MPADATKRKDPPPRQPEFDADLVCDIFEAVFRDRLGKDLDQMLAEDNDGGCCHKTRLRDAPCPLGLVCPHINKEER